MKNTPIIIGIVILILLGAGGYYFMNMRGGSASTQGSPAVEQQEGGSAMMSLTELMKLGKNQKCTYSYEAPEQGKIEGTTYIATSGKMRSDFNGTDPQGNTYDGHMINDTQYMYTWSSQTPQGVKMPITDEIQKSVEEGQKNPEAYKQYMDPDAKVDYKCSGWNGDASMFTPPADVTFTDFSAQMKELEGLKNNPDMKNAQCAACAYLQGDEQAQCKSSLGCE